MRHPREYYVKGAFLTGDAYPVMITKSADQPPVSYGQHVPSLAEIERRIANAKKKIDLLRQAVKK